LWRTALTALGLVGVLGEPYVVPTLSGDPNYVAALVAADAKIVPRLIGMAAHPRTDERLLLHYLRDSAFLWLSEVPYLFALPSAFPSLNGSPVSEVGSEHGSDGALAKTSASNAFTAGATLFAVLWFLSLGYGPALRRSVGDLGSDQSALHRGQLSLPSEGGRPGVSGGDRPSEGGRPWVSRWDDRDGLPLTHEEFAGRVREIADGVRLIEEVRTEFERRARISENLATQIGFLREDLKDLEELGDRLSGRPRQRLGVGGYFRRGFSSSENPQVASKLAFVGAHAVPHTFAVIAGWLLNSPSGASATADAFYAFLRAGEVALDPEKTTADAKQVFNNLTAEILGNTPIDLAVIVNHLLGQPDFWENPVAQGLLTTYLGLFSATYAGWTGEKIADGVNWGVAATPPAWRAAQRGVGAMVDSVGGYLRDYVLSPSGLFAPAASAGEANPTATTDHSNDNRPVSDAPEMPQPQPDPDPDRDGNEVPHRIESPRDESDVERPLARPQPVTAGRATAHGRWAGPSGRGARLVSVSGVAAPSPSGVPVAAVRSDVSGPVVSRPE
jgi:hypothetical protein